MRGDAAFEVAVSMPDAEIKFSATEVAAVGQLGVTFSRMGLLPDPYSQACARSLFDKAQEVVRVAGIDPAEESNNTERILKRLDQAGLPEVKVKLNVIGVTTMAATLAVLEPVIIAMGGPTLSGWKKLLGEAVRLAKVIKATQEVQSMIRALQPRVGNA